MLLKKKKKHASASALNFEMFVNQKKSIFHEIKSTGT